MRLVIGDRATDSFGDIRIPVEEIAFAAARAAFDRHLRFVDPFEHLELTSMLSVGSRELTGLYEDPVLLANDTSVGCGYAPLSETERLVLDVEAHLASADMRSRFPEAGEDVKVMAVRQDRTLSLTIAVAMIDRFLSTEAQYYERKGALTEELRRFVDARLDLLDRIQLNTLDDPARGTDGMYLTVLGTSAESGDSGQVGRGNRVNGLIAFDRPMSLEAAAGKNPVRHVGKIYNALAQELAWRIHSEVDPVLQVYVFLSSRIGSPIDEPKAVTVQVEVERGVTIPDVEAAIIEEVDCALGELPLLTDRLIAGEISIV